MNTIGAKILMKVLYAARMARCDLLRTLQSLASRLTRWDESCDARLLRLMCYINSTINVRQAGWIGDTMSDMRLERYADSDFAGDVVGSRSTSGMLFRLVGPSSCYPLTACSKKQSSVSHSSSET